MAQKKSDSYYVVTYRDPREGGKLSVLKARKVQDSTLGLSFVSISDFIFDTHSLVVNPSEEALQQRFSRIKSFHLSIHSIISIEEMGPRHQGLKFNKDKSNLVVLPSDLKKE